MIIKYTSSNIKLILVDDLNPEDLAMVQALKARSAESSEVVLNRIYAARREAFKKVLQNDLSVRCGSMESTLDDLMAVASHSDASAQARKILHNYYVNYNHASIADCGVTTFFIEGVSMLAVEALTHHPLFAGQVTSTRAVDFAKAKIIDPISTAESRAILDAWMKFYVDSEEPVMEEIRRRYPRQDGEDEKKYEAAVRARCFDVRRAWIPAGATTHMSITMNLRQFGDHLGTLLLHPLAEVREVAQVMQSILRNRYPSSGTFGGAAGVSGVGVDGREAEREAWRQKVAQHADFGAYQAPRWAVNVDHQNSYEDTLDLTEIDDCCGDLLLGDRPRGCLLPHWMSDLGQVSCRCLLDYGSARDLQRHRHGVYRMPLLTMLHGFEQWYIEQLPRDLQFVADRLLMDRLHVASNSSKHDRQYLIPMGYRVPVSVTYGLPAFVYVVDLRSGVTVHPTLRRAILEHMVKPFEAAHPDVKLHVDRSEDPWNLRRGQQTITKVNP